MASGVTEQAFSGESKLRTAARELVRIYRRVASSRLTEPIGQCFKLYSLSPLFGVGQSTNLGTLSSGVFGNFRMRTDLLSATLRPPE